MATPRDRKRSIFPHCFDGDAAETTIEPFNEERRIRVTSLYRLGPPGRASFDLERAGSGGTMASRPGIDDVDDELEQLAELEQLDGWRIPEWE